jgi:hypothetical protein
VLDWSNEAIEILNDGGFNVTDRGPLHGDIRTFKLRRDCGLTLFIDTEAERGKRFQRRAIPPGTARINQDNVTLESPKGAKAVLSSVDARTRNEIGDTVRETARVHELSITLPDGGRPAHTVEWLENLPAHFHWPNIVARADGAEKAFTFTDNRIYATEPGGPLGTGRHAAIIEAAGHKIYIWAPSKVIEGPTPRAGCIIYEGTPDDLTRKKFRTALSLAFGSYLVETGHTIFDKDWRVVFAAARSAYALGGRASELTVQPLIWLSDRNAEFEIQRAPLTRMVERFIAKYHDLDLPNLS